MSIRIFTLILLFFYLPLIGDTRPEEPRIIFQRVSSENGLSQDSVTSIIQDQTGFIWIGTIDGLNRFDGYNFTIFRHDPSNQNSLSDNWIRTVIEGGDGSIWVGTNDGLNQLNPKTGKINQYLHDPQDPATLSNNNVLAILEDNNGVLWVGTANGLNRLDKGTGKFTRINSQDLTFSKNKKKGVLTHCRHLLQDSAGRLFVVSYKIYELDRVNMKAVLFIEKYNYPNHLNNFTFSKVFEDSYKNFWLVPKNQGIIKLNLSSGEYTHYQRKRGVKNSLSDNNVLCIYESPSGVLWLGTSNGGINRYDREIDGFLSYSYKEENPNSLGGDSVNTIFEDKNGTLWMGIYGQGITKMIREKKNFTPVVHLTNDPRSISNSSVKAFYEDSLGTLWVGTENGLNRWDPQQNSFIHYKNDPSDHYTIGHNAIKTINEDSLGHLWIGTHRGLERFNRPRERFAHFTHNPSDPSSISSNLVRTIYKDHSGILWIGTSNGFNRFDPRGKIFTRFLNDPADSTSISNNYVIPILEDNQGQLWVGTIGGGLNRLDRKTGKFTRFFYNPAESSSISNNSVICLHEDKNGELWIGTKYGLNKKDREKNSFIHFFADEFGIPNNTIYGILSDDAGNLWLSTNRGLSRFNPDTNTVRNYYVSDGLQNNEFNGNACYRNKQGKFYFGGIKGYNAFFPDQVVDEVIPSKLVFLSFQVIGETGSRIQPASDIHTIKLAYRRRNFTIEFASLDFRFPEKNHYAHFMENFNEEWNFIGNRHFASYTNLDPGEYIFRAKGTNNSGIWSNDPIALNIIISPPFWRTWWFITFSILVVIISIFSLYKWRVGQLEKRKKELENLVNHRTAELKTSNLELEKLSLVVRETDNAVLITDAQGNFLWVNEGFTRMYDATLEQLIKEKGRTIIDSSTSPKIKDHIQTCISEKRTVQYESSYVKSNGETIWTQTSLSPHFDEDKKLSNLIAIDSDITKIKEAEEKAENANRSKGEFLARMSHEILTPMNGIIGFSDMLVNSGLNENQLDHARTIHRSGEALIFLLNDILDFSKLHTDELVLKTITFDPEVTVFGVCDVILPRLKGKEVEIKCHIDDNVPAYVKGDAGRFRQVLVNLLANAAKFTNKGEIKILLTADEQENGKIQLQTDISDTGKGIPKDKINTIFDVFEQAGASSTRKFGFPGLGLYICKKISALMGGDIIVKSEVGKGSTFQFLCQMEKSDKRIVPLFAENTFADKCILVVDDELDNQEIISRILISHKIKVTQIFNIDESIPTIKGSSNANKPFDICIIDTQVKENRGYHLAKEIRDLGPSAANIKLLAITSPLIANSAKCREFGFDGFLPKPVQKDTLLKIIEKLLNQTKGHDKKDEEAELVTQHTIVEDNKHATRILLVDDNPINLKLAKFILEKAGYQVTVAKNGQVAVEQFISSPQSYDLIFMDIQMPIMNGRDATRKIREAGYKEIPIVAMTAETMEGDREKCFEAGMDDYIAKPIKRDVVFRIIKKWCLEK